MVCDIADVCDFGNGFFDHDFHTLFESDIDHSAALASAAKLEKGRVFFYIDQGYVTAVCGNARVDFFVNYHLDFFGHTAFEVRRDFVWVVNFEAASHQTIDKIERDVLGIRHAVFVDVNAETVVGYRGVAVGVLSFGDKGEAVVGL